MQVDQKVGEVRLQTSKSGHPRTLPLEGELQALINRRWAGRTYPTPDGPALSEFVFHQDGVPVGDIRKAWPAACKTGGVPDLRFHLRSRRIFGQGLRGDKPAPAN